MIPEVRYAKSGEVHIAYQVFAWPGRSSDHPRLYFECRTLLGLAGSSALAEPFGKPGEGYPV